MSVKVLVKLFLIMIVIVVMAMAMVMVVAMVVAVIVIVMRIVGVGVTGAVIMFGDGAPESPPIAISRDKHVETHDRDNAAGQASQIRRKLLG